MKDTEMHLNDLMLDAFERGVVATEKAVDRDRSLAGRLKAAIAYGVARGQLSILELMHCRTGEAWTEVCGLSLRLHAAGAGVETMLDEWAKQARNVRRAGDADRHAARRPSAPDRKFSLHERRRPRIGGADD
jgi:hypothetical protein